jgi:metallo-beta-lactamase family protein
MAEGGRVLHHLKAALPDARNTVLFAGYQGVGTRGRRLVDGEKSVKIHGEWVTVAATIEHIDSMSAHADANEILRWLKGFQAAPQRTFIVHGEPAAQDALGTRLQAELGWKTHAPEHRETVEI